MIPNTKIHDDYTLPFNNCMTNKTKKDVEIIVTRFDESVNWLKNYINNVTIYNKGKDNIPIDYDIIKRPNIGRDGEAILYHIITNWEHLSEITFFCQGDINDRGDQIISLDDFNKYLSTDSIYYFQKRNDLPHHACNFLDIPDKFGDIYEEIYEEKYKQNFFWTSGMWISVSRDIIKRVPLNIYKKMLSLFTKYKSYDGQVACLIERLLLHTFTKEYHRVQKNIFLLWLQGWNNAPPLQKHVLKSWKLYNSGWNIITLDMNNINEYVDIQFLKNKNISPQALSDVIRINLLSKYGGIWADATLFCLKPVDEWIVEYTKKENFFMYHSHGGGMPKEIGPCIWFIVSSKNNYIVDSWKNEVNKYWQYNNSTNNYFWLDSLFKKLFENDETFSQKWNNVKYIYANDFGQAHTLAVHCRPENDNEDLRNALNTNPPEVIKLWNYFNTYIMRNRYSNTIGGYIFDKFK